MQTQKKGGLTTANFSQGQFMKAKLSVHNCPYKPANPGNAINKSG